MGGCASKPKESDSLPSETPGSPKKAPEGEIVAQENNNGGENQKEEALVDLSEPKQDGGVSESKAADAEIVAHLDVTEKQAGDNSKAGDDTTEATKEGKDVAGKTEAETDKSDAAPISEDKSDAPLVTV